MRFILPRNPVQFPIDFSLKKARSLQLTFASKAVIKELNLDKIRCVGGVDASYRKNWAYIAACIIDYKNLKLLEQQTIVAQTRFPYVPTLLLFLEAPPIFAIMRKIICKPTLLMVGGHGVSHPYGCGLATYIGVMLNIPTIGVTQGLLCGEVGSYEGNTAPIKYRGKLVGVAIKIKPQYKPLYVSAGNLITPKQAGEVVLKCTRTGRLPEPLRLAHLQARLRMTEAYK